MAKEAMEEGSIPGVTFEKYARAVGVISYFFQTSAGWLQPEVEYVYDMRVPSSEGLKLSPGDTEVETFKVSSILFPQCLTRKHTIPRISRSGFTTVILSFISNFLYSFNK